MNFARIQPLDYLLSYGEHPSNIQEAVAFDRIRATQKSLGYEEYGTIHIQLFDGRKWASAEMPRVVCREELTLNPDRHYRLCRPLGWASQAGIKRMQAYIDKLDGTPYDWLQLAGIGQHNLGFLPSYAKFWLSKRFDLGADRVVCSELGYGAMQTAGIGLPRVMLYPDRRNPKERACPSLFEPLNNPDYFELLDEQ